VIGNGKIDGDKGRGINNAKEIRFAALDGYGCEIIDGASCWITQWMLWICDASLVPPLAID